MPNERQCAEMLKEYKQSDELFERIKDTCKKIKNIPHKTDAEKREDTACDQMIRNGTQNMNTLKTRLKTNCKTAGYLLDQYEQRKNRPFYYQR